MDLRIEAPDSDRYQAALRHVARGARRTIRLAGAALLCIKRQFISVPTAGLGDGQLSELRRFTADRDTHPATPPSGT